MSEELQTLLLHTWGVACRRRKGAIIGIYKDFIAIKDRVATLRLPKEHSPILQVGQWVRILKGPYRDDLGLITQVNPWNHGVKLLVVPRLRPEFVSKAEGKRKRGQRVPRPIPALVNPHEYAATRDVEVNEIEPGSYQFQSFIFQHGLLLKVFNPASLSTAVSIPSSLATLFILSGHPKVDPELFPPPSEWQFRVGDCVFCIGEHDGKVGIIMEVIDGILEVELRDTQGQIVMIPSKGVLRKHNVGDFVEVCGGPAQGRTGWIIGIEGSTLSCVVEFLSAVADAEHAIEVRIHNCKKR